MSQTPHIDHMREVFSSLRDKAAARDYAHHMAIGVFSDDPTSETPGIAVQVYQGKLFSLSISDAYTAIPPAEAGVIIMGVIQAAIYAWTQDHDRLLEAADQVLAERGEKEGAAALREEMVANDPLG